MLICPICKENLDFISIKTYFSHVRSHVTLGSPFHFPLKCSLSNCSSSLNSFRTLLKHLKRYHELDFDTRSNRADHRDENNLINITNNDLQTNNDILTENDLQTNYESVSIEHIDSSLFNFENIVDEMLLSL